MSKRALFIIAVSLTALYYGTKGAQQVASDITSKRDCYMQRVTGGAACM